MPRKVHDSFNDLDEDDRTIRGWFEAWNNLERAEDRETIEDLADAANAAA